MRRKNWGGEVEGRGQMGAGGGGGAAPSSSDKFLLARVFSPSDARRAGACADVVRTPSVWSKYERVLVDLV